MKVYTCHPCETELKLRSKLRSLSYRSDGLLCYEFTRAINQYKESSKLAYILDKNGILLGWGLRTNDNDVMFYVRKSERRKGLGKKLFKKLVTRKKFKVGAYVDNTPDFWNHFKSKGYNFNSL